MTKTKTSSNRLQYLDWLRGCGALIMLQGHVFHSYMRDDLRTGGLYTLSQFVGGMPPAIFLFLTGVTLSFLMNSTERKGMAPLERVITAFRRSGYLFFLAFAFRIQLWIFGQPAPWTDLLRVDILNAMGFAIVMVSALALLSTVQRAKYAALMGMAIAFASPLVSQIGASGLPSFIRNYVIPDPASFSFFPWGAYLAFGVSAGSVLRAIPQESTERAIQWAALLGGGLILVCRYFASQSYSIYTKSDYWLNSPAQVLTKFGVVLLMLSVAFVWTRYASNGGWSFVRQLGTTSLLVYWVHIELVYGRWFWFFKNSLNGAQCVVIALFLILLMIGISTAKTYRHRLKEIVADWGWNIGAKPDRVPGD